MRDFNKRIYLQVFWIVIGAALALLGFWKIIDDFWSSMGFAFMAVGVVQLIRFTRYSRNIEYKEKYETEVNDERNKFISCKAWAWSGYIYVIGGSVCTIIFRILKLNELSQFCAFSVCALMVLYWILYLILKNRY